MLCEERCSTSGWGWDANTAGLKKESCMYEWILLVEFFCGCLDTFVWSGLRKLWFQGGNGCTLVYSSGDKLTAPTEHSDVAAYDCKWVFYQR